MINKLTFLFLTLSILFLVSCKDETECRFCTTILFDPYNFDIEICQVEEDVLLTLRAEGEDEIIKTETIQNMSVEDIVKDFENNHQYICD